MRLSPVWLSLYIVVVAIVVVVVEVVLRMIIIITATLVMADTTHDCMSSFHEAK